MLDLAYAVGLAAAFSILIGVIEMMSRSRAALSSCLTSATLTYLLILLVGNVATTMLASVATADHFSERSISAVHESTHSEEQADALEKRMLAGPVWFWWAFIGVFGFEVLLQNVNISMFGQGVLSINDWINKARDNAVGAANENETNGNAQRTMKLAAKLRKVSDADLKAHVISALGTERLAEILASGESSDADLTLCMALAMAEDAYERAAAIEVP